MDKRFSADVTVKRLTDAGSVEAAFSTSTIVDSDGDRVLSSAFKDGQHVGMVFSHDWRKIVGRGVVRVEPTRAVFAGKFFVDTRDGLDAYRTVKAMSAPPSIMGWSFGFRVLDSEPGPSGENVIKSVELFEVSPTLIGSNREAATLAIKGRHGVGRPCRAGAELNGGERVELRAIFARLDEQRARERREHAELAVSVQRTLSRTAHMTAGGRRRGQ
jgi:HK97 family phage prohead protease